MKKDKYFPKIIRVGRVRNQIFSQNNSCWEKAARLRVPRSIHRYVTGVSNRSQRTTSAKYEGKKGIKKKPAPGWLRNTGSNVSNVVHSGDPFDHGVWPSPEHMTIIIIIIRTCKALFLAKLLIDSFLKTDKFRGYSSSKHHTHSKRGSCYERERVRQI